MSVEKRIGAVITAAGLSRRMKTLKQVLPIGEMTMAEHVVSRFEAVGADPIVVVTGYRGDEVRQALSGRQVTFLENPDYETTQMFDSVRIGFDHIRDRCDRVFFTPVDVPLFSIGTLRKEIETDAAIVIPAEDGMTGHPVLIDTAYIPQILDYEGEAGLRGALESCDAGMTFVDVQDQGALIDADTQEDYRKLLDYYAKNGNIK